MQTHVHLGVVNLVVSSDEPMSDEEVDEDGRRVSLKLFPQQSLLDLVGDHEVEFLDLVIMRLRNNILGNLHVVHMDHIGLYKAAELALPLSKQCDVREYPRGLNVTPNKATRERCFFLSLANDSLKRRCPRADATSDSTVQLVGVCGDCRAPTWDPDLHAAGSAGVDGEMGSLADDSEERRGEPVEPDRVWDTDNGKLLVYSGFQVEEISLQAGVDHTREGCVDGGRSILAVGAVQNVDSSCLVGDLEVAGPRYFLHDVGDEVSVGTVIVRNVELVERLEKGRLIGTAVQPERQNCKSGRIGEVARTHTYH